MNKSFRLPIITRTALVMVCALAIIGCSRNSSVKTDSSGDGESNERQAMFQKQKGIFEASMEKEYQSLLQFKEAGNVHAAFAKIGEFEKYGHADYKTIPAISGEVHASEDALKKQEAAANELAQAEQVLAAKALERETNRLAGVYLSTTGEMRGSLALYTGGSCELTINGDKRQGSWAVKNHRVRVKINDAGDSVYSINQEEQLVYNDGSMLVVYDRVSEREKSSEEPDDEVTKNAIAVVKKARAEQEKIEAAVTAKAAAEEKAVKEAAEKAAAQAAIAVAEAEKKDEAAWARTTENLVHIGKLATRAYFQHQTLPTSLAEVLGSESLVGDGEDYQQLFPMSEIRGSKPFRFSDGKVISINIDLESIEGITVMGGAIKEANAIKVLNAPKVLAQAMEAKAQALEVQRQVKIASLEANLKIISKEALGYFFHNRTMPKTLDEAKGSVPIKNDGEDYQQLFPMPPVAGDRIFKFRDGSEIPLEINFESFEGITVKDAKGK